MLSGEKLHNLYHDEKLSMRKIAEREGVSAQTILNWMRHYEIDTRTISEAQKVKVWTDKHRRMATAGAKMYRGKQRWNWKQEGTTRKQHDGYIVEKRTDHPRGPWVFQHVLVMENSLGRYLEGAEEIHHINHNKADNRIENLQLFPNHSEHVKVCKPHERR